MSKAPSFLSTPPTTFDRSNSESHDEDSTPVCCSCFDFSWITNRAIFPAPSRCSYKDMAFDVHRSEYEGGRLIWIPTASQRAPKAQHRPYMPAFLFLNPNAKKVIIYSHANRCDIGDMYFEMWDLKTQFDAHVLIYEYEGYGLGPRYPTSEVAMNFNIRCAFDFVTNSLGWPASNVFLYGRSIGTGPSIHLAAKLQQEEGITLGGLILQSPFTSIRDTARIFVGFLSYLVNDIFKNSENIVNCTCPALFIHGKADTLVPVGHSEMLHSIYPSGEKILAIAQEANHNSWEYEADVLAPIDTFFNRYEHKLQQDVPERAVERSVGCACGFVRTSHG
eukprot:TRINITY_DN6407_c0_g1_i1.p1 TRINITY_DN6407_c0_g1~~TRINITY_DN6407_c0_g1_i1.p1  ORF type:complete len:334 (+),score=46.59 TRINITY_DN6407_c0_g1_i1:1352-2353(+)